MPASIFLMRVVPFLPGWIAFGLSVCGTKQILPVLGLPLSGLALVFCSKRTGQQIKIRHFQREQERTHGLTLTALDGSGEVYELQSYSYRAKGIPGESFEPKFSYCGYELIEISGYSGQLRPEDIICYTIATDAAQVGTFSCGNAFINQLHDIMVRTMVCNMQGKPTDTPIFEKLGCPLQKDPHRLLGGDRFA